MASSDIYEVKQNSWENKTEAALSKKKRRGPRPGKTFDEAVHPDLPNTHRRRSRNSGFRRLQHRLKDPVFNKKFWLLTLGVAGLILMLLIVWDFFFRYPKPQTEYTPGSSRALAE